MGVNLFRRPLIRYIMEILGEAVKARPLSVQGVDRPVIRGNEDIRTLGVSENGRESENVSESESASYRVDCRDDYCCYCIFDLEKPSRRLDSVSFLQRPTPAPARTSQYATRKPKKN